MIKNMKFTRGLINLQYVLYMSMVIYMYINNIIGDHKNNSYMPSKIGNIGNFFVDFTNYFVILFNVYFCL